MKIGIPTLYVTDCRHIGITNDIGLGTIEIDFGTGAMIIMVLGRPKLEIVETNSQPAGENGENH